jgi:predicted hotdog family 3-hydroxylacyl-ACP dehydratase
MISLPLAKPALYAYSPHQDRMLLVDRVEQFSLEPASLHSSVQITEQSVFFDSETGVVPPWIAFEYMAQSIALLSGFQSVEDGHKPKIGFIMGIRDFSCEASFPPGSRVDVRVHEILRDGDVGVFEGTAELGEKIVAKGIISTISASEKLIQQMRRKKIE